MGRADRGDERGGGALIARLWRSAFVGAAPTGAGPVLKTERLTIRPPRQDDHLAWSRLRRASQQALKPWEPSWAIDHLSHASFRRRVRWSAREIAAGRAYPLLLFERVPGVGPTLVGGLTIEHVRLGAAMSASLGYWLGVGATGRGLMTEALEAVTAYAFETLNLSRLEAACLPENGPSRRLLLRCGFQEEGLARAYLRIDGAWRDHVVYERRRADRVDVSRLDKAHEGPHGAMAPRLYRG